MGGVGWCWVVVGVSGPGPRAQEHTDVICIMQHKHIPALPLACLRAQLSLQPLSLSTEMWASMIMFILFYIHNPRAPNVRFVADPSFRMRMVLFCTEVNNTSVGKQTLHKSERLGEC